MEANPDPCPKAGTPVVPKSMSADGTSEGEPASAAQYIGAFGGDGNWLQEWTLCGPASDYETREVDDGEN